MATITKRGSSWRVQVRLKGYQPVSETFASHEAARHWAAKVEGRMASGDWVGLAEDRHITLGEALKRYESERTDAKKGSRQEHQRIAAWSKHELALRSLQLVRSRDIAQWRAAMVKAGKAPPTIRNAATIISQVYETARTEWGFEDITNPVRGVRMPKAKRGRDRRLENGEEERLMTACGAVGIESMARWAIETAMRQGEMLSLRWCDLSGPIARLRDSKTNEPRAVPLSLAARAVLGALPRTEGGNARIFPISASALDYRFRLACGNAAIARLRWHDLRHEAVSRLFEKGLDAMEVASISGHRTLAMLKRYTHFRAAALAAKLG